MDAYTNQDFKTAISFISEGGIDVKTMITMVLPLDSIKEGFEALARQET